MAVRAAAKASIESKIAEQQQLYASLKSQIAQMVQAEQARQLQMARMAQARMVAQRQAQVQATQDTVVGISAVTPQSDTVVAPPPTHGGVVGDRDVAARDAVRVGRCSSRRFRLLWPRDVGVRAGRRVAAAFDLRALRDGRADLA